MNLTSTDMVANAGINVSQRLQQWTHEATEPNHPNYKDAELDFQVRKYAEIAPLLQKLRENTQDFSTEDVTALIGALNSGARQKNNIVKNNSLPELRTALLSMLDGPGYPSDKIAEAQQRIKYAGSSILGELYGWAHIDEAPLFNECATDALRHLGYDFPASDYDAFVDAHEQFKHVYTAEAGRLREDIPLNLEIDKLYNVIDKVDLKALNDAAGTLPTYDRLMNPTIQALKELGGSGTIEQIDDQVIGKLDLTEEQKSIPHSQDKSRPTEIEYRLGWTRTYLKKYGIVTNTGRGVWTLTELGQQIEHVDMDDVKKFVLEIYKEQQNSDVQSSSSLTRSAASDGSLATGRFFSEETFGLLDGLYHTPTAAYYSDHKAEFQEFLERPFKELVAQVADRLPAAITEAMETRKRVVARILKNDFGQGGAWPHYWGAFYPRGSKRSKDAQLSIFMDRTFMEFGFYIGEYGSQQRQRFQTNCETHYEVLCELLAGRLGQGSFLFGDKETFIVQSDGSVTQQLTYSATWQDFLRNPTQFNCDASAVLSRDILLNTSREELVEFIVNAHSLAFPLILLATLDDPIPAIVEYLGLEDEGEDVDDGDDVGKPNPIPYTRADFLADTHLTPTHADEIWKLLHDKKQVIFFGPPGTGKSYVAQHLARWLTDQKEPSSDQVEMIQFHPAYSYEDFIEGIRPKSKPAGEGRFVVDYPAQAGVFRRFCERAAQNLDRPHVFIIDEINRGNIPRIFGELMLLLEYRNKSVALPYSGKRFSIPPNVYLIATMNTADRSIALVDFALRRRFHFIPFAADPDLFERWLDNHDIPIPYLAELYRRLSQDAIDDANFAIGPSYFMDPDLTETKLARIWRYSIEPYLEEYYVGQPSKVAGWRWDGAQVKALRADQ